METLYGTLGTSENKDLLATGEGKAVAISLKPGKGVVPYGAVIYRNSDGLYEPAAAAQVDGSYTLLILRDETDTDGSETIAAAAAAYEAGAFKAGTVKIAKGDGKYTTEITVAQALALRQQGIVFRPFDNWAAEDVTIDNGTAE